jgi:hypothetical protein
VSAHPTEQNRNPKVAPPYHCDILAVVQTYVDRERMFSFCGSLNPEIQTFIEDELHQDGKHLLLPKNGSEVATIEKVRSLAVLYETRGKNRANDMGGEGHRPRSSGQVLLYQLSSLLRADQAHWGAPIVVDGLEAFTSARTLADLNQEVLAHGTR